MKGCSGNCYLPAVTAKWLNLAMWLTPAVWLTSGLAGCAGAQLDDRDTFLGVGTNRLVRWDQV